MSEWHFVCSTNEIDEQDLIQYERNEKIYAVYNTEQGFYATDGICSHEYQELAEGLVFGTQIECPLHQGRFDIITGKAIAAPVCVDLASYPVKIENNKIFIKL